MGEGREEGGGQRGRGAEGMGARSVSRWCVCVCVCVCVNGKRRQRYKYVRAVGGKHVEARGGCGPEASIDGEDAPLPGQLTE